jgi:homopolymeric O-antigen transport system ATP-binding protein
VPLPSVEFRGVSKSYPIYASPRARLKELASFHRLRFHHDFLALRDVSFQILPGETFCVIGENGSGKSTLLQIMAGILRPTLGEVFVQGRVAALLELGSGFNPEFTGRQNVYLNAAILGLSRREIDNIFGEIEAFAEIGEFVDQPVKTYSSGMVVRLAFAVAIQVHPDILLVDEALSVGDVYFRQRCLRKIHEMRAKGVAIVFVSHALGDVQSIGDRAMWLDSGQIREMGATDLVVDKYRAAMAAKDNTYVTTHRPFRQSNPLNAPAAAEIADRIPNVDHRFGDGRAEVIGIAILDAAGSPVHVLEPSSQILVRISVCAHDDIPRPIVGFVLRNHMGLDFAGTNTAREHSDLGPLASGDICTVDFCVLLPELYPSSFSFSPAVADGTLDRTGVCDWIDNALVLEMSPGEGQVYGYVRLPCRVELNSTLSAPAVASHPVESSVG